MSTFPHITDPSIHAYCTRYSTKPSFISEKLESVTEATGRYGMASGKYLGQFLRMMSHIIRPKVILELGTFTGYGTLCLREGLSTDGLVYTIEKDKEYYELSRENFSQQAKTDNIKPLYGDANELIAQLDEELDLVFIDAAKRQYSAYYDLLFPKLRIGGVIIADNVLWKGKVGHPENDKLGQGLDAFNKKVYSDQRVDNLILPIDDGVNFIIKRQD